VIQNVCRFLTRDHCDVRGGAYAPGIARHRTGGRLHEIRRLDDLSRLYAQVAADLRTLYTVVYQPPNPAAHDGKWREIRVEVGRGDLVASTKPGYYAR